MLFEDPSQDRYRKSWIERGLNEIMPKVETYHICSIVFDVRVFC